ncbi:Trp biosynthesis-associated membrane protein [Herbidospora cretacea]|uniref:Trp biosynthesis-associated membrane protein n=1 Tax=Herbidospora cretacea TaxID=28444 RepID=UPI000772DB6C|nr:Trp biosynthesis-associated membrane protein [Herbidospora cretacea]
MNRRAVYAWLVVCAAGGALALLSAGQVWAQLLAPTGLTNPEALHDVTGPEVAPVVTPVTLAALAGCVAVLATKGVWRQVIGALVAICGGAVVIAMMRVFDDVLLLESADLTGAAVQVTVWPWLTGAGGVLLIGGGLWAAVAGGRWPGMSSRYDRTGRDGRDGPPTERSMWDAIDRGDDPT